MSSPPPPAPASERDRRGFALLAVLAGLFAALCVDTDAGLNVVVVGVIMGAAVLMVARPKLQPIDWAFGIAAILLLSTFALLSAEWVLLVNFAGAAGLGSLAMHGGRGWWSVLGGGFAVLAKLHRGLGAVLRLLRDASSGLDRVATAPVLRGTALAVTLAIVFGVLFASADQAFAQLARDFLVPEWNLGLLPARIISALVVVSFTGAYALVATTGPGVGLRWSRPPNAESKKKRLSGAEWIIPVVALDVLFAVFVLVQLAVLFGGQQHVLTTAGLTYAEYARSGFFQLVAIAGLVLLVIAATVAVAPPRSERERRVMQVLLGILCVLTLVILLSALRRLGLYEEAFGFTRLRFFVHATIFWLSGLFLAVMIAGAVWRATWLPRVTVGIAAALLVVVNLINPDAFIAQRNIERYATTGKLDVAYLTSLSADAIPAIALSPVRLPDCVLARLDRGALEETSLWSFNLSRVAARSALGSLPPASGSDGACPP
jgi:Domain of unknown function (DUF4173)